MREDKTARDPNMINSDMKIMACIGAGNVGAAWAVVFARAGYRVKLYDIDSESIHTRALPNIRRTLGLLGRHEALSSSVAQIMDRIEITASVKETVQDAIYVQESVREDVSIKRVTFAEIAAHASEDCILASSTSAIKGSAFMSGIPGPERALVAHPVNPPALIPLVELCPTPKTAKETVERAKALLSGAGMRPVTVNKEIDGFLLNRLQYTLVAEALHLVGEGYCSVEDIDRVMTDGLALRWASIGPFETAHLNASAGFQGFVDQLGPMMKKMGQDARTDYDWDMDLAAAIHAQLIKKTPVADLPGRQAWRDEQILKTRAMQKSGLISG